MAELVASPAGELTTAVEDAEPPAVVGDDDRPDNTGSGHATDASASTARVLRAAAAFGCVALVALGALCGWLGYRVYESQRADQHRARFVTAARQAAINLSTIDFRQVDSDVKRILDMATGSFRDEFQQQSQAFVEVVTRSQSTTKGTVSEAGIESETRDSAQVLVALAVRTSDVNQQDQPPRHWRMRLAVQQVGDEVKVANVNFVP